MYMVYALSEDLFESISQQQYPPVCVTIFENKDKVIDYIFNEYFYMNSFSKNFMLCK